MEYSPVAALNRAYAFSRVNGNTAAISETEKLALSTNQFYHTLLGELYKGLDVEKSKQHYMDAIALAKTNADKQVIQRQLELL